MNRFLMMLFILASLAGAAATAGGEEIPLEYGRFGKLTVYRTVNQPSQVVLFVSGDGGWNLGVVDMARSLADMGTLVVGIDITAYFKHISESKASCVYPAADFEEVSKFVQKKLNFPEYKIPVLVGYSSGATLVYAVMIQAPYNTFQGAMSLGFCPDLLLHPTLCKRNGLDWKPGPKGEMIFQPFSGRSKSWIVFQGEIDQVCDSGVTAGFVKQVKNGKLVALPHVGHGFSVQKNWLPQFKKAFSELTAAESTASGETAPKGDLSDLPLVEVPSTTHSGEDVLAVLLSGDGGWAGIDQGVSRELAARGVPVVGVSTLKYFWQPRTPEGSARDLERILRYYLPLWKKDRLLLLGYSLGADILPFMVNRLPAELKEKIALVVLLGPDSETNFEFHLSDWLGGSEEKGLPTLPEISRLSGIPLLCIYGKEDKECICSRINQKAASSLAMPGGHHFGEDYPALAKKIMNALEGRRK